MSSPGSSVRVDNIIDVSNIQWKNYSPLTPVQVAPNTFVDSRTPVAVDYRLKDGVESCGIDSDEGDGTRNLSTSGIFSTAESGGAQHDSSRRRQKVLIIGESRARILPRYSRSRKNRKRQAAGSVSVGSSRPGDEGYQQLPVSETTLNLEDENEESPANSNEKQQNEVSAVAARGREMHFVPRDGVSRPFRSSRQTGSNPCGTGTLGRRLLSQNVNTTSWLLRASRRTLQDASANKDEADDWASRPSVSNNSSPSRSRNRKWKTADRCLSLSPCRLATVSAAVDRADQNRGVAGDPMQQAFDNCSIYVMDDVTTKLDLEKLENSKQNGGRRRHKSDGESKQAMAEETDVVRSRRAKVVSCCKSFAAFLFSTIGLTCLLVGYVILGGVIFVQLEADNSQRNSDDMSIVRREHVDRLWALTEAMNVLHPDNWTAEVDRILENYTQIVHNAVKKRGWDGNFDEETQQWSFPGALLYSITVITTIGYGHITPKTKWGQVVTIIYAIFGIPLSLLTITNLGGFMATAFRFIYRNVCCGICCLCCPADVDDGATTDDDDDNDDTKQNDKNSSAAIYEDSSTVKVSGSISPTVSSSTLPASSSAKSVAVVGAGRQKARETFSSRVRRSRSASVRHRRGRPRRPKRQPLPLRERLRKALNTDDLKTVTVPIYVSLLLITGYIAIGAMLFTICENDWTYLIGCYFCFVTLSTIGFGDYVPGTTNLNRWGSSQENWKLVLCALYLLVGLALLAMCFDLIQEQARCYFQSLGRRIGILEKKT